MTTGRVYLHGMIIIFPLHGHGLAITQLQMGAKHPCDIKAKVMALDGQFNGLNILFVQNRFRADCRELWNSSSDCVIHFISLILIIGSEYVLPIIREPQIEYSHSQFLRAVMLPAEGAAAMMAGLGDCDSSFPILVIARAILHNMSIINRTWNTLQVINYSQSDCSWIRKTL